MVWGLSCWCRRQTNSPHDPHHSSFKPSIAIFMQSGARQRPREVHPNCEFNLGMVVVVVVAVLSQVAVASEVVKMAVIK